MNTPHLPMFKLDESSEDFESHVITKERVLDEDEGLYWCDVLHMKAGDIVPVTTYSLIVTSTY